jgi:AcrR family transcriptional regulator
MPRPQHTQRQPTKQARGKQKPPGRARLEPELRRRLIVEAAFKAIATTGFEGLRTRDIATRVGINSATLHHHFRTKQDLVDAVANRLEERLRCEKSDPASPPVSPALAVIEAQFADVVRYQKMNPDILAVYRELVTRAPRDAAVRTLVERLHDGWRVGIVSALKSGQSDGTFRRDIDPEAAAGLILSTVWGHVSQIFASAADFGAAARELTLWLRSARGGGWGSGGHPEA